MKAFFLAGSIVFTVLILILAFENMGANCTGFLFLFAPLGSMFFGVIALCATGVFAGIFYAGLVMRIIQSRTQDEESPGGEW
jgi:hypothetical protein